MKTIILSIFLLTTLLCRPAIGGDIQDAAENGDLEKVKPLPRGHPNLAFSKNNDDGLTPLLWAAYKGHKHLMQLLLAKRADVNARNNDGQAPLRYAAGNGYKDVAELLRQQRGHE